MKICHYQVLIAIALLLTCFPLDACGQSDAVTKKTIRLHPQSAQAGKTLFHLFSRAIPHVWLFLCLLLPKLIALEVCYCDLPVRKKDENFCR